MTHIGIVVLYHQKKFWGFIKESDGDGTQWFFHMSNCPGFAPQLGVTVEFEIAPPLVLGQKDQAVNVRLAESGAEGAE